MQLAPNPVSMLCYRISKSLEDEQAFLLSAPALSFQSRGTRVGCGECKNLGVLMMMIDVIGAVEAEVRLGNIQNFDANI